MKKEDLKIIFLGTPGFAVATLKRLVEEGYNVVGVVTAPDRMGGRGMKQVIMSDVKKYALKHNLLVLQPKNLKSKSWLKELEALKADLQIVVAFRMLPVVVWDMPPLGTYNLHGSLLPAYRGAAPIQWAIVNGETKSGVTSFKLRHEIDTGAIALTAEVTIEKDDYFDDVHDKMMEAGASVILRTVEKIMDDSLTLEPQDESKISKAPKIFHQDCELDFTDDVTKVYNKVRGLSPYPVSWTLLLDKKLKIYKATYSPQKHDESFGQFISDGKNFLGIFCRDGLLFLEEVQPEGKRRMTIKDYINGLSLKKSNSRYPIRLQAHWA